MIGSAACGATVVQTRATTKIIPQRGGTLKVYPLGVLRQAGFCLPDSRQIKSGSAPARFARLCSTAKRMVPCPVSPIRWVCPESRPTTADNSERIHLLKLMEVRGEEALWLMGRALEQKMKRAPLAPGKNRGRTGKITCQSGEQEENQITCERLWAKSHLANFDKAQ